MKTSITEVFGIEHPIIQGGMAWASYSELAAAVSEAGGLGLLGSSTMQPDELRSEIAAVRKSTDKPFGVNIPIMNPFSQEMAKICVEEKVKIVFTAAGNPAKYFDSFKSAGALVVQVVATVRQAKKAQSVGVDAIVAEGFEAGGHNGHDETTTMALIPQVREAVDVPIAAAGGIMDARGFVAAMALGADGVQLGTRFIACTENNVHENFKKMLVDAGDTATVFIGRKFGPTRVLKNKVSISLHKAEIEGDTSGFTIDVVGPGRGSKGCVEGDVDEGLFNAGQACGLIHEVKPAAEIIKELMEGYEKIKASMP